MFVVVASDDPTRIVVVCGDERQAISDQIDQMILDRIRNNLPSLMPSDCNNSLVVLMINVEEKNHVVCAFQLQGKELGHPNKAPHQSMSFTLKCFYQLL